MAKDPGFIYPFSINPYILLIRLCPGSIDKENDLDYRNVLSPRQAATRELLQSYRTKAYAAIAKRLDIHLLYKTHMVTESYSSQKDCRATRRL
jgi:hypothetical protein